MHEIMAEAKFLGLQEPQRFKSSLAKQWFTYTQKVGSKAKPMSVKDLKVNGVKCCKKMSVDQ